VHLILPKMRANLEPYRHLPLFFLAGPTSGGGDWHRSLTNLLLGHVGECIIVNPSWDYDERHPHYKYRMPCDQYFEHALDFELCYLDQAALHFEHGCIIFWLACESKEKPRADGQPYARDSRDEVGEWRGYLRCRPDARVAMGIEEGFPGRDVIERKNTARVPGFITHRTMEETVKAAARIAKVPSFAERMQA
jgi:hypothetical protein